MGKEDKKEKESVKQEKPTYEQLEQTVLRLSKLLTGYMNKSDKLEQQLFLSQNEVKSWQGLLLHKLIQT